MKQITALIVEDSRLARNEIRELLKAHPEVKVIGEAENVDAAYQLIREKLPDLLFLDINMPEKSGFDLLEMLDEVPMTIFTTAYDEYAIQSFEYNTLDYLLKPISPQRLGKALARAHERLENYPEHSGAASRLTENSQIFIKDGERCWLVRIGEVRLFEIVGNYTRVFFGKERPLLYKSLQQIEDKLPEASFFRANRQQIVNINEIEEVLPWFHGKFKLRLTDGSEVEVSRRQSAVFKDRLSL